LTALIDTRSKRKPLRHKERSDENEGLAPRLCGRGDGGAAYARTPEWAVLNALGVAQADAEAAGFFGQCTIVGQPRITEIPDDPYRGHTFNASLKASCEQ
jgi:hypothetical protein